MNRSDAPPKKPVPFAVNGQREALLPSTPAGDNTASYNDGFPPVTMILKSAGGLPPKGQDMNQILYELSTLARWSSAGALNTYDSSFSTGIGGYPSGAVILSDDGNTIFINRNDANTTNPNSGGAGWLDIVKYLNVLKVGDYGVGGSISGSAAANAHVGGFLYEAFQAANLYPESVTITQSGGPTNSEWGQLAISYGTAFRAFLGRQIFGGSPEISELYHVKNKPTPSAIGAQPVDSTLTTLSGKDAAGLRSVLGLGTTATRNVGTGASQIPDMSSFLSGSTASAFWYKLPGGMVMMGGNASGIASGTTGNGVFFPVPFPNACSSVVVTLVSNGLYADTVSFNTYIPGTDRFNVYTNTSGTYTIYYLAFGS
ncbi:phage tail protein [Salmonella enterica]|nr:phage tail protein [Salmonella enterica]